MSLNRVFVHWCYTDCSSVLYSDSGWFTSPNYPNDYDNNLACSWLINATDKIVLTFQTFSTELGHDIVSVYYEHHRYYILQICVDYINITR